jgi:hypothetical protein
MSTLSTTVRRGLVVTAAAMAAGPVVGGVASAATAPTTNAPLDTAPISTAVADAAPLSAAPLPMTRSALPLAGGLDSIMPISGGLAGPAGGLPLNQLTGGLPVSGLAGGLPVVGPMAQNLPLVGQLTDAPPPTPPANAAAGTQAASDLKAAFPAPHMPTPPALMTPAPHAGTRSRTVSPVAPAVSAPTMPTTQSSVPAPAQSSSPLGNLPVVGGLTQGLPVGGLTGILGHF